MPKGIKKDGTPVNPKGITRKPKPIIMFSEDYRGSCDKYAIKAQRRALNNEIEVDNDSDDTDGNEDEKDDKWIDIGNYGWSAKSLSYLFTSGIVNDMVYRGVSDKGFVKNMKEFLDILLEAHNKTQAIVNSALKMQIDIPQDTLDDLEAIGIEIKKTTKDDNEDKPKRKPKEKKDPTKVVINHQKVISKVAPKKEVK